jgi:lysyl-tRNA synthetase class II
MEPLTLSELKNIIADDPETFFRDQQILSVIGMIVGLNRMTNSCFVRLSDSSISLQAYINKGRIPKNKHVLIEGLDLKQEFVFVGRMTRARTGEWILGVTDLEIV